MIAPDPDVVKQLQADAEVFNASMREFDEQQKFGSCFVPRDDRGCRETIEELAATIARSICRLPHAIPRNTAYLRARSLHRTTHPTRHHVQMSFAASGNDLERVSGRWTVFGSSERRKRLGGAIPWRLRRRDPGLMIHLINIRCPTCRRFVLCHTHRTPTICRSDAA